MSVGKSPDNNTYLFYLCICIIDLSNAVSLYMHVHSSILYKASYVLINDDHNADHYLRLNFSSYIFIFHICIIAIGGKYLNNS